MIEKVGVWGNHVYDISELLKSVQIIGDTKVNLYEIAHEMREARFKINFSSGHSLQF